MKKGLALPILAILAISYLAIQTSFKTKSREKLDEIINSEYQEVRPMIAADGKTLYFARRNHPQNLGGTADFQDIWMSRLVDGQWTKPINLGTPVNNKKTNTLCSITDDGKLGLFLDSYRGVKTPLSISELTAEGWQKPKSVQIADFVNLSSYYDFHHNETRGVLLSAINNGRGYGDQDLHVSFLQKDGSYIAPINLGAVVNSRKADFAPFLAADGKTLFYASFGHKGFGGSDLFVTQRLDESWRKWSKPVNLGMLINSELDENYISVTADLDWVYFESYATGSPEKDIYRASLKLDQILSPQPVSQDQIAELDNEKPTVPDNQPQAVKSQVTESVAVANPISDGTNTSPNASTPKNHVYQSDVKQASRQANEPVAYTTLSQSPQTSLTLEPRLEEGLVQSKVTNNLYFATNSTALPPHHVHILDQVSQILSNRPQMKAYIEGHTDNLGPEDINLRISHLRAQRAAHYVLDKGIPAHRIHITGKGEAEPLASNDDELEGRELNRRVEIVLSDGAGAELLFVLN